MTSSNASQTLHLRNSNTDPDTVDGTDVAQLVERGAEYRPTRSGVGMRTHPPSESPRPLPKPEAIRDADGTGNEHSEAAGSSPAVGTHSRAGDHFRWRQPLGRPECPYAYRWVLPLGPLGSLRLHWWVRSDDMRAAHDHPSGFLTVILRGAYNDVSSVGDLDQTVELLTPGMWRYRPATHRHRVSLVRRPCVTLLWFSPPTRDWGFYRPRKSGGFRFVKAPKWFKWMGTHPCDQP